MTISNFSSASLRFPDQISIVQVPGTKSDGDSSDMISADDPFETAGSATTSRRTGFCGSRPISPGGGNVQTIFKGTT